MTAAAREVILRIMAAVDDIDAHEHTKRSLKNFINEACLAAGITVVDRRERILFARRLLDDGEPRPTIRDRLMIRFAIKRATAYAVIEQALQLSKNREKFWTNVGQDTPNDPFHSRTKDERFSER